MRTLTDRELARFYALSDLTPVVAGTPDGQTDSGMRLVTNVPVFPQGVVEHPEYGTLTFDPRTLREYVQNFRDRVRKIDIAVDLDHKNEVAAGWVRNLKYIGGDGVYADIEFNRLGQELLADKRYKYVSPQFGDYTDEQTGETYKHVLIAIALTNWPFLKSLPGVSLSERRASRRARYIIDNPDFPKWYPRKPSMTKTKEQQRCRSACERCARERVS